MLNIGAVYGMRQAGASLQQIAEKTGRSKERIRQLLVKHYGSTKFKLLTTAQLCNLLGLSRHQITNLYQRHIITPTIEWSEGKNRRLFWAPQTIEMVIEYYREERRCKICFRPIPKGRRIYCSSRCYQEGQKYIYKDARAKKRRLSSIRKSIQKRRLMELAQDIARGQRGSDLVLVK